MPHLRPGPLDLLGKAKQGFLFSHGKSSREGGPSPFPAGRVNRRFFECRRGGCVCMYVGGPSLPPSKSTGPVQIHRARFKSAKPRETLAVQLQRMGIPRFVFSRFVFPSFVFPSFVFSPLRFFTASFLTGSVFTASFFSLPFFQLRFSQLPFFPFRFLPPRFSPPRFFSPRYFSPPRLSPPCLCPPREVCGRAEGSWAALRACLNLKETAVFDSKELTN